MDIVCTTVGSGVGVGMVLIKRGGRWCAPLGVFMLFVSFSCLSVFAVYFFQLFVSLCCLFGEDDGGAVVEDADDGGVGEGL